LLTTSLSKHHVRNENRDVTFSRRPRGTTTAPGFGGGKKPIKKPMEKRK
jgi:hypothetical protein